MMSERINKLLSPASKIRSAVVGISGVNLLLIMISNLEKDDYEGLGCAMKAGELAYHSQYESRD